MDVSTNNYMVKDKEKDIKQEDRFNRYDKDDDIYLIVGWKRYHILVPDVEIYYVYI